MHARMQESTPSMYLTRTVKVGARVHSWIAGQHSYNTDTSYCSIMTRSAPPSQPPSFLFNLSHLANPRASYPLGRVDLAMPLPRFHFWSKWWMSPPDSCQLEDATFNGVCGFACPRLFPRTAIPILTTFDDLITGWKQGKWLVPTSDEIIYVPERSRKPPPWRQTASSYSSI